MLRVCCAMFCKKILGNITVFSRKELDMRETKRHGSLERSFKKESFRWSVVTTVNKERRNLNCFSINFFSLILLPNAGYVSKTQLGVVVIGFSSQDQGHVTFVGTIDNHFRLLAVYASVCVGMDETVCILLKNRNSGHLVPTVFCRLEKITYQFFHWAINH